ncbi:hypothetical protein FJ934_06445 [Mesorhizobium sp. B2-4-12]|nr:hypothetical protein FJ548_29045 [Mesorhizobium sp. B2-4-17]TPK97455.1 hypothetical protein FJ934_06445 [Mesorhizobium sp. B2-4-12]
MFFTSPRASAAPHLAAAIFSPYSDGEKDAAIAGFANCQHCEERGVATSLFLPVTLRGEMPGRAMRGGADAGRSGGASNADIVLSVRPPVWQL